MKWQGRVKALLETDGGRRGGEVRGCCGLLKTRSAEVEAEGSEKEAEASEKEAWV